MDAPMVEVVIVILGNLGSRSLHQSDPIIVSTTRHGASWANAQPRTASTRNKLQNTHARHDKQPLLEYNVDTGSK